MPKVPQYIAGESIRTGSTGPEADASSFAAGAGLGALAQGLQNVGGDLSDVAYRQKLLGDKKKRDDENQWLGLSLTQLDRVFSEFTADENNASKETFATDFDKFSKTELDKYQSNAPSPRASQYFKARAGNLANTYYSSTLRQANRTRVGNQILSFQAQTKDGLLAFRNNVKAGNPDALNLLDNHFSSIFENIRQTFEFSPETAHKLQAQLVEDVVLGTARHDPKYARDLLERTDVVDEGRRETLLNRIESIEDTGKSLLQEETRQTLGGLLDLGERGQPIPAPNEAQVKAAFGTKADAVLLDFKEKAQKLTQANAIVESLADKNAGYQDAQLVRLQPDTDSEVYSRAVRRLEQIQKQQVDNPSGFNRTRNDIVVGAYDRAANVPDSLRGQYLTMAHDVNLKYQGYAPEGAGKDEAAKYLGLPEHERRLLTTEDAKEKAGRLKSGSTKERVSVLADVLAGSSEDHQRVMFNDLVAQGVHPSLQLAFMNYDPATGQFDPEVNEYVNILDKPEALKGLTEERTSEFLKELAANDTWQKFMKSIYVNGQRVSEIGAWQSGIVTYAHALSIGGQSASEAVDTAVSKLVSRRQAFPVVHGQPLMIDRVKRDGTSYTDEEIEDLGRRLAVSLREIPVEQIDQAPFALPPIPENDPKRLQLLRNFITSSAYWHPSPDGRRALLYARYVDGSPFQIRDKSGEPVEIELESVPTFESKIPSIVYMGMRRLTEKPSKTYPLSKTPMAWPEYFKNSQSKRYIPERITTLEAPK